MEHDTCWRLTGFPSAALPAQAPKLPASAEDLLPASTFASARFAGLDACSAATHRHRQTSYRSFYFLFFSVLSFQLSYTPGYDSVNTIRNQKILPGAIESSP